MLSERREGTRGQAIGLATRGCNISDQMAWAGDVGLRDRFVRA